MGEPSGRTWIAITNHKKFIVQADTFDQAATLFQQKTGHYPQPWQLELMETVNGSDPKGTTAPEGA